MRVSTKKLVKAAFSYKKHLIDLQDKEYIEAIKVFNTSASQIASDLGKEMEWHRQIKMSSAKLCQLIMCNILQRMKENVTMIVVRKK